MRFLPLFFWVALAGSLGADPLGVEVWGSVLGKGDGTFESQSFRVVRTVVPGGFSVETSLPATGKAASKILVDLDDRGNLVRSRTDYFDRQLAQWYRADFLLTEVQAEDHNLAFQRVQDNQVQEAKNLAWGPEFIEFSTLPFFLERRLARGDLTTFRFKTYYTDQSGTMDVSFLTTDRPLALEPRYSYPRVLRERFGNRPVVLASLNAIGAFKGGYPFPFFYAFTPGKDPRWVAAWGGNPRATSFQWRESVLSTQVPSP